MNVLLVGVGRNLNRAIRTCYSFGVECIYLLDCDEAKIKGNLYSAKERVPIIKVDSIENLGNVVAFEVDGNAPISELKTADCIAIGGESTTLSKVMFKTRIGIPTKNKLCLTTEAALAIALYAYTTEVENEDR